MERVLYNTVLGAKPLESDGHAFYYADYNFQATKSFFPDRWPCCSGTLPQVATDYRLLIYFRDPHGIYVNLYLPSTLKWTSHDGAQLTLTQKSDYPRSGHIRFDLHTSKPTHSIVRLRIPSWSQQPGKEAPTLFINGAPQTLRVNTGFATIDRTWKDGDRLELSLPMPFRLQPIDSRHTETVALMRGPLVLFAQAENPRLTRSQLLNPTQAPDGSWTSNSVRFVPFVDLNSDPYTTYITVT
jgi:uncharacterized protein